MEFTFPSGHKVILPAAPSVLLTNPNAGKPKRAYRRTGACKHIGQPIAVAQGCTGPRLASTWECALHGQCAPLAIVPLNGVATCRHCEDFMAAAEPGYFKLGTNYLSAQAKWHAAGKPTRTQKRVNELLAICRACPFLSKRKDGRTYCGKCGCGISAELKADNKLYLATESCPLNPPRWTAEEEI